MAPIESIEVFSKQVSCEGESPSVGHPKVYLEMGNKNEIICPYCSRRFKYNCKEHDNCNDSH
jgi:uncharacterized Zn-finger protein